MTLDVTVSFSIHPSIFKAISHRDGIVEITMAKARRATTSAPRNRACIFYTEFKNQEEKPFFEQLAKAREKKYYDIIPLRFNQNK